MAFPFAPRVRVKLNYQYYRDSSASVPDNAIIALNNAYDLDYSGSGHQPMGFDQYAALYNAYRVHAVSIKGQLNNSTSGPCIYTGIFNVDATPITGSAAGISRASEQPLGWCKPVKSSYAGPTPFNKRIEMHTVLGMTREQYRVDDTTAAVTSSAPATIAYMHNAITDGTGSGAAGVFIQFRLVLDIEFFLPIQMTQS